MLGVVSARGPGEISLAGAFYCAGGEHEGSAVSWRGSSPFSLMVSFKERTDLSALWSSLGRSLKVASSVDITA